MPAPWQDPELVARGREPMHAIRRQPGLLLDGTWRFQLLPTPDAEPGARVARDRGPRLLDHAGHGRPAPVHQRPDALPGRGAARPGRPTPRASTSADFDLPTDWQGQRVVLHVGAAESVVIVELNGRRVGIGKDSHLASEFDVSAHVVAGRNVLRLTVVKWSDATFIEDQDQWWHGGLTRSVYLYATPPCTSVTWP